MVWKGNCCGFSFEIKFVLWGGCVGFIAATQHEQEHNA